MAPTARPPSFPPANPPPRPRVDTREESEPQPDESKATTLRVDTEAGEFPASSKRLSFTPKVSAKAAGEGVSNRLTERLAELRTAKSKARLFRIIVIVTVSIAALLGGWIIGVSPLLALDADEIEVVGRTSIVPDEKLTAAVGPYIGVPLIRVDTASIEDALSDEVMIKGARVVRHWPNGLHVTLQVRTAVAASKVDSGYSVLDRDGVILTEEQEAPSSLPILDIPVGTEHTAASLAAVLEVMDSLPAELLERVESAGAPGPEEVTFILDGGARVSWGSAEESELKAAVLQTLLDVPAKVYNVSAPLNPITS